MSDLPAVNGTHQLPAPAPKELSPAAQFLRTCESMAARTLKQMLGAEKGGQKAAAFAVAFQAAASLQARTAKHESQTLYACDPESVSMALVNSIITGIMPGGPAAGCYILPKDGRCQWWLNHRGMIQLARQSGQTVTVRRLFQGEDMDLYEDESGLHFRLPVSRRDPGVETYENLSEVVVIVRSSTGQLLGIERVSKAQIEARRRKSQMANAGPWKEWALEMADKTAIKYAVGRGLILISDDGARHVLAQDEEDTNTTLDAPAAQPKQIAGPDPLEILDAPARREPVQAESEEAPAK